MNLLKIFFSPKKNRLAISIVIEVHSLGTLLLHEELERSEYVIVSFHDLSKPQIT
jgi:hypothetical protein